MRAHEHDPSGRYAIDFDHPAVVRNPVGQIEISHRSGEHTVMTVEEARHSGENVWMAYLLDTTGRRVCRIDTNPTARH